MGLTINTNTRSLNSLNTLQRNQPALNRAFQRLSSGLRINSAADDAAGLAISSRFTSQFRGLNQAVRNASDGISAVQVAESGLGSVTENLQRIRELSLQAANGTLNDSDRRAIQAEVDQISSEIGRISDSTTFNGRRLLQGGGETLQFQVGAGPRETVGVAGVDARAERLGTFAQTTGGAINPTGLQAGELTINGVGIRATQLSDDTRSTANRTASAISVAAAINASTEQTGVTARAEATQVSGGQVAGGALDSGNRLTINGVAITSVDVSADDAGDSLVNSINANADQTGVTASRNAGGGVDLTAADGRNIQIETTGNAAAITGLSAGVTTGQVTLSSDEAFRVGGTAPGDAGFAAGQVGADRNAAVDRLDVTTVEGANRALASVDRALEQVGSSRSRLGAVQNRLESTISNLANISENIAAANSRIRDTDFAEQSAELVRRRILDQANISVLAQANISNRAAVQLLGG